MAVLFDGTTNQPAALGVRASPGIPDLLNSCPGSKLRSSLPRADNCVFTKTGDEGGGHSVVQPLDGTEIDNCDATARNNVDRTVGGTTTFFSTWTLTETSSVDFPGISASWNTGQTHTSSRATTQDHFMSIPAGQRGRLIATQFYQPILGSVLINYGSPQGERGQRHFYWTVSNVRLDGPSGEAVIGPEYRSCKDSF